LKQFKLEKDIEGQAGWWLVQDYHYDPTTVGSGEMEE